jgi:hypothetical protein
MKFDFIDVFVRSAKITWKYKVLWIFGIFAGCNRSSGSNSNNNDVGGNSSQSPFSPQMEQELMQFIKSVGTWFIENPWVIYAFIAFVLISIILQVTFFIIGTAGLIRGATKVEQGEISLSFGNLFSESLTYFWRVFGAALVIWLPTYIIFVLSLLLVIIPLEISDSSSLDSIPAAVGVIIILLSCCCMLPIFIALGLYNQMVNRAIVVENHNLLSALKHGWQVLKNNLLPILGIGLILFLLGLLSGILISLPLIVPAFLMFQNFIQDGFTSWQPFINLIILSLCYTPIYWFLNGLLTTYTETVWTLSYLGFTRPDTDPVLPDKVSEPNEPILA